MKEIEILVSVSGSPAKIRRQLRRIGSPTVSRTIDQYYFDPKRSDLRPNRSGRLMRCFRLRDRAGKFTLTYKVDRFDRRGKWKYSDEHETLIEDGNVMRKIIQHLGLQMLVCVDSIKHVYRQGVYEIVYEQVKGLGQFLEVELKSHTSNTSPVKAKAAVWQYIKKLELHTGPELNAGKPELLLQRQSGRKRISVEMME